MVTQTLLLLGGNVLNCGFADVAARHQWALKVVDWNGADKVTWLPSEDVIKADIKAEHLVESLSVGPLAFCYSSADVAAENVMRLNRKAGLLGPSMEAIHHCVYKNHSYACFDTAGVLGRKYLCLSPEEIVDRKLLAQTLHDYLRHEQHLVVKPTNSSSSRGVTFLRGPTVEGLTQIITAIADEFKAPVLVDKYISGDEYSIEMLADSQGNIMVWPVGFKGKSIYHTSEAISVKVIYNPVMEEGLKERMVERAIACAKATGIRNSLVHLEMKLTPEGALYPMEIASRSSGFVASHLCDMVSPHSYLDTYYDVLRGKLLTQHYAGENEYSSTYFFYDLPDGEVIKDLTAESTPFRSELFECTHHHPVILNAGEQIAAHKNDDTKKNFAILRTRKRAGLHEELITLEKIFYATHVAPRMKIA